LSYPGTDIFLLCFSIISDSSFDNIKTRWMPELIQHAPEAKIMLIGTKTNLRKQTPDHITISQGEKLAKDIKAIKYVECSALSQTGLKLVFDEAVKAVILPQKKKSCNIL